MHAISGLGNLNFTATSSVHEASHGRHRSADNTIQLNFFLKQVPLWEICAERFPSHTYQ